MAVQDDAPPRMVLEGWLQADITGKQKKWTKTHKRWFVLSVGSLAIYDSPEKHTRHSFVELHWCAVRSPKTKRKDQPFAFRIDVSSWRK